MVFRLRTIGLIRISEVRGHFPEMASHNSCEAFPSSGIGSFFVSGNPYPGDETPVCGFPLRRGDKVARKIVFPGHPKRPNTATRSSKPAIFAGLIAPGISGFEAAPSEIPLLRLVARIMLHRIASRGSDRFRGFFDRSTYTLAAQFHGHFEQQIYGANGIQDPL
jgi:hypothetical protein